MPIDQDIISFRKEAKMKKKRRLQDRRTQRALLVWGIPKDLMKSFKLVCVLRGTTMKAAVIDLIRGFCERGGHRKEF